MLPDCQRVALAGGAVMSDLSVGILQRSLAAQLVLTDRSAEGARPKTVNGTERHARLLLTTRDRDKEHTIYAIESHATTDIRLTDTLEAPARCADSPSSVLCATKVGAGRSVPLHVEILHLCCAPGCSVARFTRPCRGRLLRPFRWPRIRWLGTAGHHRPESRQTRVLQHHRPPGRVSRVG